MVLYLLVSFLHHFITFSISKIFRLKHSEIEVKEQAALNSRILGAERLPFPPMNGIKFWQS